MAGSECSSFESSHPFVNSRQEAGSAVSPASRDRQQAASPTAGRSSSSSRIPTDRKGKRKRQSLLDIVGHDVEIPGQTFGVSVPGLFYTARVMRKDSSHKDAVTLRFKDDNSRYWLPIPQVRQFLREQKEREESGGVADAKLGVASDQYAAEVLVSLSGDRSARSRSDPDVQHWGHEHEAQSPTRRGACNRGALPAAGPDPC